MAPSTDKGQREETGWSHGTGKALAMGLWPEMSPLGLLFFLFSFAQAPAKRAVFLLHSRASTILRELRGKELQRKRSQHTAIAHAAERSACRLLCPSTVPGSDRGPAVWRFPEPLMCSSVFGYGATAVGNPARWRWGRESHVLAGSKQ